MLKKLLILTLAGSLILETPISVCAAIPQIKENNIAQEIETREETSGAETGEAEEETGGAETGEAEEETDGEETGRAETEAEEKTSGAETEGAETEAGEETGGAETEGAETEAGEETGGAETEKAETETEAKRKMISDDGAALPEDIEDLVLGETKNIVLEGTSVKKVKYSFTASEAGYYNFYGKTEKEKRVDVNIYSSLSTKIIKSDYISNGKTANIDTYINEGETIYIELYQNGTELLPLELQVQKLTVSAFEKKEDGTYSAETESYGISIFPEEGNGRIRFYAALEAKGNTQLEKYYTIKVYYKNTKTGYEKNNVFSLSLIYHDVQESIKLNLGSEYEFYFVLQKEGMPIVITDKIKLKTGETEEEIVHHGTEVTENSIMLDMEILNEGIDKCYYYPVNATEDGNKKSWSLQPGWKKYDFPSLNPDTEYIFEFYDKSGKMLFETTAKTTAIAQVMKAEYYAEAAVGEDGRTTLALEADVTDYTGKGEQLYLVYEYTNIVEKK